MGSFISFASSSKTNTEKSKLNEDFTETPDEVIVDLEKGGYNFTNKLVTSNISVKDSIPLLIDVMKNGADEFQKRTGRPMTYAEMRTAYG